ncbi:MAG: c-type cytochrome [Sulfurimonas sp.]|jgi:cytochrome c oxidase cbb3-type subunit 3
MNKTVLAAIIVVIAMLGFTYVAVEMAGGVDKLMKDGDWVNMLAILGAVILVIVTSFVVTKYVRQMQSDTATGKLADENWDGIGEYKNELPFGWAVIFLGSIVWAMWYFLAGYPVNAYSQIGEYNADVAVHDAKFEAEHKNMDAETLKEMGGSVFIVQCAPCHGLQADGIDGKAANLTHRLDEKSVKHVINNGGNNFKTDYPGGMPPMLLQDPAQIDAVAKYVASGFKADDVAGKAAFTAGTCNTCHGENGEGMPSVAPKINGWEATMVATVLKDGKKGAIGAMPAFNNLTEVQVKALGAYVTDLSK